MYEIWNEFGDFVIAVIGKAAGMQELEASPEDFSLNQIVGGNLVDSWVMWDGCITHLGVE